MTGKERGLKVRPLCVPESLFVTLGKDSSIFIATVSYHSSFLQTTMTIVINNSSNTSNSNGHTLVTCSVPGAVL